MIHIDDSGSGSPVGSVGIGVYRVETGEYHFELIPVEYFQGLKAGIKDYLAQVIPIVERAFANMGVPGDEPISVCRGNMFDALKPWLTGKGYAWEEAKIEGECQRLVEDSYSEYLRGLGVPQRLLERSTDYRTLNILLEEWVGQGFRDRASVCKQWGKGWQRICARYAVSDVLGGLRN